MKLTELRKGQIFALTQAVIWGLFPVVAQLTLVSVSPFLSAAIATLISSVFFAVVLTVRGKWADLGKRRAWMDMLRATLVIGVLFYVLYYSALRTTSAGNASIVGLMEVFFTFLLLAVIWKKERLVPRHVVGGIFMVIGAGLILSPNLTGEWNPGDFLILISVAIAPIGNFYAKRARSIVSSEAIMFFRSLVSGLVLLLLSLVMEGPQDIAGIQAVLPLLVVNGIVMFGLSKLFWIEAAHRMPISQAISITSIAPLATLSASYAVGESVTVLQVMSLFPIALGIHLLARGDNKVIASV